MWWTRGEPEPEWTPEQLAAAWKLVDDGDKCPFCGGYHDRKCPKVKRISYFNTEDGRVESVEFFPESEWDQGAVIFADLLPFQEKES